MTPPTGWTRRATARGHVALLRTGERLRAAPGQGTVEYVALILLVALVMAGVLAALNGFKANAGLGQAILAKIKEAVGKVQF